MYAEFDFSSKTWKWFDKLGNQIIPNPEIHTEYYVYAGKKYFSQGSLKRQGLTPKKLEKYLGEPDIVAPNKRYNRNGFIKLYLVERVNQSIPF